jgi:hypothetical protein
LKIGLGKEGLTINSKKFDPYNFSLKGIEITVDKTVSQTNPLAILEGLASIKKSDEEVTNLDKLKVLQNVINRTI